MRGERHDGLELRVHDGTDRRFALREGEELLVGAAAHCAIRLAAPDVSRRHALVVLRRGRVLVMDLGSKNGTYVGGEVVAAEAELGLGETVRFASVAAQLVPAGDERDGLPEADTGEPVAVGGNSRGATGDRPLVSLQQTLPALLARWAEPGASATGGLVEWLAGRCGVKGAAIAEAVAGEISLAAVAGAMVGILPRVGRPAGLNLEPAVELTPQTVSVTVAGQRVVAISRRGLPWLLVMPGDDMLDTAELELLVRLLGVSWRIDRGVDTEPAATGNGPLARGS